LLEVATALVTVPSTSTALMAMTPRARPALPGKSAWESPIAESTTAHETRIPPMT
jgi:hypothetical protein